MRSLHLLNFRCYVDLALELGSGINLFIGDNASGKTSLLKACQYVMSAFFSGFSDVNTKWLSFSDDDFMLRISGGKLLPSEPIQIEFDMSDLIEWMQADQSATPGDLPLQRLERRTAKGARILRSGLKEYTQYARDIQHSYYSLSTGEQVKALPLFAYYSVEDIHTTRRLDTRALREEHSRHSLGYLGCLEGDGFLRYWLTRLLILKERDPESEEVSYVCASVLRVVGGEGCDLFSDIRIYVNAKKVAFLSVDGREIPANYLSEGQKRVLSIAFDLAFRSYLLNYPLFREATAERTTGVVLIDEVDMHMHPRLQAAILPVLHRVYPRLQFIASTHAPMVMSTIESTEDNRVYRLAYREEGGYVAEAVYTYGLDLSTLVRRLFALAPRALRVEQRLSQLMELIDAGDYPQAHQLMDELLTEFPNGEVADLSYAAGMLDFLESGDNDTDQEE